MKIMAHINVVQLSNEACLTSEYFNSNQPYDEITLEYVSGVSCKSKSAIAANPCNGNVAFVASSVLVISDPQYPNQAFIENPSAREIGCVTFSGDGRFFAYGEFGFNPSVAVFNAKNFTQVNTFPVHEGKSSIKALQFHPRSIYLAILLAHDYGILVYEFVHGRKLAAAKWCMEPLAMTMTSMDCLLAVCGHRKISCFSLSNVESTRYETNAMLEKRAVLLGKHGNYTFIDIVSGQNRFIKCIYTVTSCGSLCEIKSFVIKDVLKVSTKCFCVKFALGLIFMGCEKGMVNICNPGNLTMVACIDDNDLFGRDQRHPIHWAIKSDIIALTINQKTKIVTTLMANQHLHSWRIQFVEDGFECAPVIVSEAAAMDTEKRSLKMITPRDLNCTIAQLLIQLEISNRSKKSSKTNFLQRQPFTRFRELNAIKITPDGEDIIVGNRSGEIKVYEATTGILKKVIEAHNAEVTYVEVMYDNDFKLVATGGRDRIIFILNAQRDYRLVQAINDHASAIVSISLAHNNGILTLVSSSKDGTILIRRAPKEDTPKFVTIGELPENLGSKKRSYNYSKGYIVTGQEKGRINVFPFDPHINLKPITKIQIGNAFLKSVAIDPTSSFFVAFGTEGQYVFHLQTGHQIATLCYLPGFNHLSFSQDLNYFINSNDAGCKFMWRLPTKIIEVMHANLKDSSNKVVTSREFIFNSYMSCVRVCQHLVGEDEDGSSTIKANEEVGDSNIHELDNSVEGNLINGEDKAETFPNVEKKQGHMTITDKGHEIMNFLCEDNHVGLVESTSCVSCCTTYSRSLTDMAPIMDTSARNSSGGNARGDNPIKREKRKTSLSSINSTGGNTINKRTKINNTAAEAGDSPTLSPTTTILNNATCKSVDMIKGMIPSHALNGKDGNETSKNVNAKVMKNSSKDCLKKCDRSNGHCSSGSRRETRADFATALVQPAKSESLRSNCEKTDSLFQDSVTVITALEKLTTPCADIGTVDVFSSVETTSQMQGKCIENTSQMKDSGVVEDLNTDYTMVDIDLENSTVKRLPTSSPTFTDLFVPTPSIDENAVPQRQCSQDVLFSNEYTAPPTGSTAPDDNLETLRDLEDNGQLQEYYTEFCRNIHLSNSQETYVLKESGDLDLLNIALCLDDPGHRDGLGKASLNNTNDMNNTLRPSCRYDILSSIEAKVFGSSLPSNDSVMGLRDFQMYQHDMNLRQVFLSWVRRKLNKERKRKKLSRPLNQGQGHKQDGKLKGISKDAFPSDAIFEEMSSTTDTDFVSTESNVTCNTASMCREVVSNVHGGEEAHMPSQTLSEPVAASRYNAMSRSEVGLMQWHRSFHYRTSNLQSRTTCNSPTRSRNSSPSQDNSQKTSDLVVPGDNDAADDFSNSSVTDSAGGIGGGTGAGAGAGASGVFYTRKSAKFCQPTTCIISPNDSVLSLSGTCTNTTMEQTPQTTTDSLVSNPATDCSYGMAKLFRNQDDYLRKLKEVRRNFEKSIQELSNERKNQQIEAQKYFMKH